MAFLKTGSFSIDLSDVKSVRIQTSALAFLPKIVSLAVMILALYFVANFGGIALSILEDKIPFWSKTWQLLAALGCVGVGLAVVAQSASIIMADELDDGAGKTMAWVFGIAVLFCLFAATMSFQNIQKVEETGGSFGDNVAARVQFLDQQRRDAWMVIGIAVGLIFSFFSLALVGMKDVKIVRSGSSETIRRVTKEEAVAIMNGVDLQQA